MSFTSSRAHRLQEYRLFDKKRLKPLAKDTYTFEYHRPTISSPITGNLKITSTDNHVSQIDAYESGLVYSSLQAALLVQVQSRCLILWLHLCVSKKSVDIVPHDFEMVAQWCWVFFHMVRKVYRSLRHP